MASLTKVEFVLAIEEAFEVEIPDAAAEVLETPRHVVELIVSRQLARRLHIDRAKIEHRVLAVLAQLLETPSDRLTLDMDLAELAGFRK